MVGTKTLEQLLAPIHSEMKRRRGEVNTKLLTFKEENWDGKVRMTTYYSGQYVYCQILHPKFIKREKQKWLSGEYNESVVLPAFMQGISK